MASKRLGRLRQWAGEVISSKDKTLVTDEFKDLEIDIELRRKGIAKLYEFSESYHNFLTKKRAYDNLPEESANLAPRDALGIVMISHGEEFGDDSAFGTSMVKVGNGMRKISTFQEAHALDLQGQFIASLQVYLDEIKEYHLQKKKLDSKRLNYDAALNKIERLKNSKKEKDKLEAEEELDSAKSKYEEVSESVHNMMHAIQENEIDQLKQLECFLDLEIRFAEQYVEVMKTIKSGWVDISTLERAKMSQNKGTSRGFSARSSMETKSVKSHKTSRSRVIDTSDEEEEEKKPPSRGTSSRRMSEPEKVHSRSTSRASRKRSDSAATTGEKEKNDSSLKSSVAGWASSAVSSVAGLGKKDKENFVGLSDGQEMDPEIEGGNAGSRPSVLHRSSTSMSKKTTPTGSPSVSVRGLRPSLASSSTSFQEKKIVRALYDFHGSPDELSFKAGDEILLLNEVTEGWWMGDLNGKKGLFPTTYTEPVTNPSPPIKSGPQISQRLGNWKWNFSGASPEDDAISKVTLVGDEDDGTVASFTSDDDEPTFGDHNRVVSNNRSPIYGIFDTSVNSATENHDDSQDLGSHSDDERGRTSLPSHLNRQPSFGRKAPPPPPPRRLQTSLNVAPRLPDRNIRSISTGTVPRAYEDSSPFDSPTGSHFDLNMRHDPFRSQRN